MDILLIDDHILFRDGVSLVIEKLDDEVHILPADDAQSAIATAEQYPDLDLVLLDYNIPGNRHFSTLAKLKDLLPATPIILISAEEDSQLIQEGLQNGASGFVTKSSSSQVMLSAIQLILAGGLYVPPAILKQPVSGLLTESPLGASERRLQSEEDRNADGNDINLTERQKEVLFYMDKGMPNKEIAKYLVMSPSTVKVHVAAILREGHAANRTQAVSTARQCGAVPQPEDLPKNSG